MERLKIGSKIYKIAKHTETLLVSRMVDDDDVVVVVVVVVFTLKTIPVSLSSTSFCLNLSVLIHHLTRPISVVTG